MNSVFVANITVADANYVDHLSEFLVDLNAGTNILDIVHYPDGGDSNGANLGEVKLQRLIGGSLESLLGQLSYVTNPLL